MIFIAHRGNFQGRNIERENSPEYIKETLEAGFDVEVDVWFKDESFYLGHDEPQYKIDQSFLEDLRLWSHAKNIEAFQQMLLSPYINCFWHQTDKYTLTSAGYIWTFPREKLMNDCIAVCPEIYPDNTDFSICAGICSDNVINYRK